MTAVRIKAVVPKNRKLELQVPESVPVGEVEVEITTVEQEHAPTNGQPVNAADTAKKQAEWQEFLARLDSRPGPRRTLEDINAQIEEERNSWE